jgi:hypothetical protein
MAQRPEFLGVQAFRRQVQPTQSTARGPMWKKRPAVELSKVNAMPWKVTDPLRANLFCVHEVT